MNTVTFTLNNRRIEVPADKTILEAAQGQGVFIPTLCFANGSERFTSCMLCVVHELGSDRLLPSCSAPVAEGMRIETDNKRVEDARRDALNFLLSEHIGDCEAPCQRACPAQMNIPLMIRQIQAQQMEAAIKTIKQDIALPAILGHICPAPCEKGCKRKFYDAPLSICLLKRFAAEVDLAQASPYQPPVDDKSGKKVAIVGTGPAGLAAAYYLLQKGHACSLFEQNSEPGGQLRYGVPEDKLPRSVLNAEIERILSLGAEFFMEQSLGRDVGLEELCKDYDALVLAVGTLEPEALKSFGLEKTARGIAVDKKTFETSIPGVFAGGNAIFPAKMAVRAVAHGKNVAASVDQFLNGKQVVGVSRRFNSVMGKMQESEAEEFLKEAEDLERIEPSGGLGPGFAAKEAAEEASRCFGCDCRKPETCKLRRFADEYAADQQRFKFREKSKLQKVVQHDLVIYEPGKCIKCSLCVQITKKAGEEFGFTFINRGFEVRVTTPFHEPLQRGLQKAARDCVEACPTAALSWRKRTRT